MQKPTRRALLAGLSGVAACGPADRIDRPAPRPVHPPAPTGQLDAVAFPGGIRAGDPTSGGWVVAVPTTLAEGTLALSARTGDRWTTLAPRTGLVAIDGWFRVEVDGLEADTEHRLVFTSPDGTRHSAPGVYRTSPIGRARPVVFGATTCLGNEEPTFPTLAVAAGMGLDFFLFLGDSIYTRADTLEGYRAEYAAMEATPSVRALLSGTPLVALWDDHEVADDWSLQAVGGQTSVSPEQLALATAAFREALPQRPGPGGSGMWRSLRIGTTVELVLLDCRGERGDGRLVSDAQLAWALATIEASPCLFKVVCTSVHLTDHGLRLSWPDDTSDIGGRWQGFPEARERLLAVMDAVPGVAVISGGMHYGGIQWVGAPGDPGDALVEVAVGPSGSGPWDLAQWLADTGAATDGYLDLVESCSVGRFVADPVEGTLVVEMIDGDGAVRARRTLVQLG